MGEAYKMKIIVTTCDEYIHFLKGFVYMFNKHWPSNAEVTVLGYSAPSFDLPDNFKFISLGEQRKYGRDWTSALIPFFKQLPDEYFMLFLDDYYILNVDESLLDVAEEHAVKGKAEKVCLKCYPGRIFREEKDVNFSIWNQDANYRLSLAPGFYRRDYFLKYLIPGKTIWEYEIQATPMNDGAQLLVPKQDIVSCSNFVLKGKTSDNSEQISKIGKEDLGVIKQLRLL